METCWGRTQKKCLKQQKIGMNIAKIRIVTLSLGISLVLFGLFALVFRKQPREVRVRYDNHCKLGGTCLVEFELAEALEGPIFVFLELTNFHQNHKKFCGSVPRAQLADRKTSPAYLRKVCTGAKTYADFDINDPKFPKNETANPCGLMSKYFPQDEFVNIATEDDSLVFENDLLLEKSKEFLVIQIENKGIEDPYFSQFMKVAKSVPQWVDIRNGRFANWMVCLLES